MASNTHSLSKKWRTDWSKCCPCQHDGSEASPALSLVSFSCHLKLRLDFNINKYSIPTLGYHRKNSVVVFLTVGDSVWSINIFSDARLRFSRPTQSLNIYVKFASADDRWWIGLGSIFIRASDEFCELNADIYDLTWHIISLCSLLGHTRSGIGTKV